VRWPGGAENLVRIRLIDVAPADRRLSPPRIRNGCAPRGDRLQHLRIRTRSSPVFAGTQRALRAAMSSSRVEPWTIPLHVIMWTTISAGFIMMLVVAMMH
jgi:hypothetical protein